MSPLRGLAHLSARFFGVLASKPLRPGEQKEVRRVLTAPEAALFFRQQPIDQRHAYQVAVAVDAALPGNEEAMAAALLHDVGKTHSHLGAVGRSLATVADGLRLPMPSRWRLYRDHGPLGAADLARAGARPLAVAFAAGEPAGDDEVWRELLAADDAAGSSGRGGESPELGAFRNSMPPEVDR